MSSVYCILSHKYSQFSSNIILTQDYCLKQALLPLWCYRYAKAIGKVRCNSTVHTTTTPTSTLVQILQTLHCAVNFNYQFQYYLSFMSIYRLSTVILYSLWNWFWARQTMRQTSPNTEYNRNVLNYLYGVMVCGVNLHGVTTKNSPRFKYLLTKSRLSLKWKSLSRQCLPYHRYSTGLTLYKLKLSWILPST